MARDGEATGPDQAFEAHLRFEGYLTRVASRFLSMSAEAVEGELTWAVEGLLNALDVDRCGMALFTEDSKGLPVTHNASQPGIPPHPLIDLAEVWPWYTEQVRSGRPLVFPRLPEGLPPEAEAEAEYVRRSGILFHVALPMKAGGEVQGAVSMSSFRAHRGWDPSLVPRFEVLAGVLANALYRRRAEARLRTAAEVNQSILASLSQEVVVVDDAGRVLAVNEAWTRAADSEAFPRVEVGDDLLAALEHASAHGQGVAGGDLGLRAVLSGERKRVEGLCRHQGPSEPRVYLATTTLLTGTTRGAVAVHADVTELDETRSKLKKSLEEVRALKERLEAENVALQREVRQAPGLGQIVGTSSALERVHEEVEQVAATDAPVLLLGETGTGKELVARALHERSRRARRPLVTVNCAALPPTLMESEVFGYEKGAFTGALKRSVGRFEAADGGTLFLDEIGELPLDVQAKLLRVLQTGQFERLGSTKTVQVDVRLIAATNRDLETAVGEGRFRNDLYYRLNVFPIPLPPLRERREDIPLLVWHFIERRQGRLGRSIKRVPDRLMEAFTAHDWPGNVRELENMVERALIRTRGDTLAADPALLEAAPAAPSARTAPGPDANLSEVERAHIVAVLEECGWKVAGKGGAAGRLGLKRSTLQSRMAKLGITRADRPAANPRPGRGSA